MFRRWLRPGELPQHGGWDLWRLREIGGWGDTGRMLGARWEQIGGALLVERLGARVVPLWRDRALGRWMGTLGLPNPDALLLEPGADAVATVRPIDLKWSLDTSEYAQIAGETLRQLVDRGGQRTATLLPPAPRRFGDGLFAAPDRPLNRLYLQSAANAKREYPIQAREVDWLAVSADQFFPPLPGWAASERLATLDGVRDPARDVELAERFFHLGAGARGVLLGEQRTVFAEREGSAEEELLVVDPRQEQTVVDLLDRLVVRFRLASSRDVVAALAVRQRQLQERRVALRAMLRAPLRFGEFMTIVTNAGRRPRPDDESGLATVREIFSRIAKEHAAAVRARGLSLVAAGLSDDEALERTRTEVEDHERHARARAHELLSLASPAP